MSAAYFIAGLVFVGTFVTCAVMIVADAKLDAHSIQGVPVAPMFWTGMTISALIAASHFIPHLRW